MNDHVKKIFHIYEIQYNQLLKRAVSILGNLYDAEEAMQEVAITLIKNREIFEEIENIRAYLYTLTHNKSIDLYRKQKAHKVIPTDSIAESELVSQDKTFESIKNRELIEELLEQYTPELKEAFILHVLYGYSIKELALKMGISENALSQRLKRMKTKIAKDYLLFILLLSIFR